MGVAVFEYNLTVRTQAMLNLRTDGRPSPSTALFKKIDGVFVRFNSERFTVTLLGITISSVEPEDVGEYKLSATYETYFDEEEFTIVVTSKFMLHVWVLFSHVHTVMTTSYITL